MRRLAALLTFLTVPAFGGELVDRMQIPERRGEPGRPVYVASLAPLRTAYLPVLKQVVIGGGSGGASGITIGTTTITSGTDGRVLYDNNGVVGENANLFFDDAANANFLRLGSGTAPGALRLLEGSASGTNYGVFTVPTTLGGNRTYTGPDFDIIIAGSTAALTATRVPYATTGGLLTDSASLTTDGTTWTFGGNPGISISSRGNVVGSWVMNSNAGTGGALFFGTSFNSGLGLNTTFTPDSVVLGLPSTSNTLTIMEEADRSAGFDANNCDAGTSAAADPGLCIMSHNQDVNEWVSLRHDGGSGTLKAGNSAAKSYESRFGRTVTLTEAGAAETVITIVNATTETFGIDFYYMVTVTDGTDRATRKGYLNLVCDNAATVMTCTKDATAETDDASILIATGGATLTYAIASDVATASTAKLTFDINSSLVVSAASITWRADLLGKGTIQ